MNSVTIRLALTLGLGVIFAIWMAIQIGQGSIYVPVTVITFITVPLLIAGVSKSATFSVKLVMMLILGFSVLGKGFAYLAIKPPMYASEMVLAIALVLVLGGHFAGKTNIFPRNRLLNNSVIIFILICLVSLVLNFRQYGMFALRDTSLAWYSLYYFITYGAIRNLASLNYARRVLLISIGVATFIKLLLVIFGDSIRFLLDVIKLRGTPIFYWTHDNLILYSLAAFCVLYILALKKLNFKYVFLCGFVGLIYVVDSKSAYYFALIAGMAWMSLCGRKSFVFISLAGMVLMIFMVFTLSTITSNKRIKVVSDRLLNEARGASSESFVIDPMNKSESSTTGWRLAWGAWIWNATIEENIVLGLGMGADIETDFAMEYFGLDMGRMVHAGNSAGGTRYPHNIIFTVIARTGFLGLMIFSVILFAICREAIWYARIVKHDAYLHIADVAMWFLLIGGLANAFVQTTFEAPYVAVIFWSCLGMAMRVKELHISQWQEQQSRLKD